ncbi:6535_t:CDS:2, partial [Entrophospora sp. SA101]
MPYSLFSLFFTVDILDIIVYNTNIYADEKGAGAGRRWDALELNYWKTSDKYPQHKITEHMSLIKFEQIKRYFHVSDPTENIQENTPWYHKIEPLASSILNSCMKYYLPSSNLS